MLRFNPKHFGEWFQRQMRSRGIDNYRELTRRVGGSIQHSTFNQLANGRTPDPGIGTILGVVESLRIPPHIVMQAAAGLPVDETKQIEEEALFLLLSRVRRRRDLEKCFWHFPAVSATPGRKAQAQPDSVSQQDREATFSEKLTIGTPGCTNQSRTLRFTIKREAMTMLTVS